MQEQPSTSHSTPPLGNLPIEALQNMIGGFVMKIFAQDIVIAQLQKRIAELEVKE